MHWVALLCLVFAASSASAQPTGGPPGGGPPGGGPGGGNPPAEQPPEKKVEHEEEQWFVVKYRKDAIGWFHYTLDRIGEPDAVRGWRLSTEWQMAPVKGLPVPHSGRSTALVNPKWELTEGEWGGYVRKENDDQEIRAKAKLLSGELWIDGPGGSANIPGWVETDWGIEPMIGKFLLARGLATGKAYVFKIATGRTNPILNEVQLQVKDAASVKSDAGTFSGLEVSATVPSNPPLQNDVLTWTLIVDEKGRIVHYVCGELEYLPGTEAARENVQLPFAARGRRDPFRNPMIPRPTTPIDKSGSGSASGKPTIKTLEPDVKKQMLQQASDVLAKMTRDNEDTTLPQALRLNLLGKSYDELSKLWTLAQAGEQKDQKFLDSLKKVMGKAQELYSGVERLGADMERIHNECRALFEEARYTEIGAKLAEAKGIASNPAIKDTRHERDILKHYQAIDEWNKRGVKREAFKQRKPQIIGIIYYLVPQPLDFRFGVEILGHRVEAAQTIDVARSQSSAILQIGKESQIWVEGQDVDADLRVQKIERHAVVFQFKGEQIRVELGRE